MLALCSAYVCVCERERRGGERQVANFATTHRLFARPGEYRALQLLGSNIKVIPRNNKVAARLIPPVQNALEYRGRAYDVQDEAVTSGTAP